MPTNNALSGTSGSWTTTTNWSQGHAPTSNEYALLTTYSTAFTGNLAQTTVVLGVFNQDMSFTGTVGANGSTNTYLQIAAPIGNLGLPSAGSSTSGSRLLNWDAGTSNTVINVMNTATSGTSGAPVKLLCTNATVNLTNGIISIAALASETATVNTLNVTGGSSGPSPQAYFGPGCTVTTMVLNNAGAITSASQAVTSGATLTGTGAALTYIGSGGFSSLNVTNSAKVTYTGYGSVNAMTLGGTLDCSNGGEPFTVAASTFTLNARLIDPLRRITFTNPPVLLGVAWKDIYVDRGITGGGTF